MLRIRCAILALLCLPASSAVTAQSLFIAQGERAVEGSAAWSVGPFSQGVETQVSISLDGRWDVGFGVNRYAVDLGGPDDASFVEWSPMVRYVIFKEGEDATPVSLVAHAQYFRDSYDGDAAGWYLQTGGQLYKRFELVDGFALYPYVGFSLVGEASSLGGEGERALYLSRQFGVHGQVALGDRDALRVTVEEQAFRRETYRAVRAAYMRRF